MFVPSTFPGMISFPVSLVFLTICREYDDPRVAQRRHLDQINQELSLESKRKIVLCSHGCFIQYCASWENKAIFLREKEKQKTGYVVFNVKRLIVLEHFLGGLQHNSMRSIGYSFTDFDFGKTEGWVNLELATWACQDRTRVVSKVFTAVMKCNHRTTGLWIRDFSFWFLVCFLLPEGVLLVFHPWFYKLPLLAASRSRNRAYLTE